MKNQVTLPYVAMSSPSSEAKPSAERGSSTICAAQSAARYPDPRRADARSAHAAGMTVVHTQSGSIFLWIFIAIALFAALSFVLSQGSRTGITQLTKENAKLASAEILDQSRGLKAAIQQLRINGCTDTQISFEYDDDMDGNYNEVAENYNNAAAPTNYTCHVFHQKGGALSHVTNWLYQGTNPITGVGTDPGTAAGTELVAMFPITNVEDCLAINKQFDIAEISGFPPHDTGGALTMFNGTYGFGAILGDEGAGFSGKQAGCFRLGAAGTTYYFYQVLIAR